MKDKLKHIKNQLRTKAWNACFSTDILSLVRKSQKVNQNTELDYHNFLNLPFEYLQTCMSSRGAMAIAWLSLAIVLDKKCSNK